MGSASLTTGNVLDMYKAIAWELGLPTERSRATAYRAIREEITRLVCEAKQLPVLVIDEALTNTVPLASAITPPSPPVFQPPAFVDACTRRIQHSSMCSRNLRC